jgi:hypothetical protein
MIETITTTRTVKVKSGTKFVSKTIRHTEVVILASALYTLAAGKSAVVDLALTKRGQSVLKTVAKKHLHETLVATVKGGDKVTRTVVVS